VTSSAACIAEMVGTENLQFAIFHASRHKPKGTLELHTHTSPPKATDNGKVALFIHSHKTQEAPLF
jgi:hypothetical protein